MDFQNRKKDFGLLVLLFFPIFLVFAVNRLLFPQTLEKKVAAAEEKIDQVIGRTIKIRDAEQYFTEQFLLFEQKLERVHFSESSVASQVSLLKKRYPGMIEVVFLDGKGEFVPRLCDRVVPKRLCLKFLQEYRKFRIDETPLSRLSHSFVTSFLGELIPREKRIDRQFLLGLPKPKEQYVYMSRFSKKAGFFVFLSPSAFLPELALDDCLEQLNRAFPAVKAVSAFSGDKVGPISDRLGLPKSVRKTLWKDLCQDRRDQILVGNTLVKKVLIGPSIWVIGATDLPLSDSDFISGNFFLFLSVPFGIFLFLQFTGISESMLFSIRGKMILAFLYSSALPLIIMALVAGRFLGERQATLERRAFREIDRITLALDLSTQYRFLELDRLIEHLSLVAQPDQKPLEVFQKHFEGLRKKFAFGLCRVYDSQGNMVFDHQAPGERLSSPKRARLYKKITLEMLEKLFGSKGEGKGNSLELVSSDARAFAMTPFEFGKQKVAVGTWPLGNSDQKLTHLVFFVWRSSKLKRQFFEENLSKFSRQLGNGGVLIRENTPPYRLFPPKFRFLSLVEPILGNIHSPVSSYRKIYPHGKFRLLVSGIRGTELDNYSLVGVQLDMEMQRELSTMRWKFFLVGLVVFAVGGVIGMFLGRLFIVPIRDLEAGIVAIESRDFSRKIPIESEDEFGKIAKAFNETMEDWRDLEVAKEIQDHLFPQEALVGKRFSLFGRCRAASRVGGDFFDFFPLADGKVLFAVGDVSGHGIGAALVVAIAKALIKQSRFQIGPCEVLEALHKTLFAILKKEKIMSCIVGIFDENELQMSVANAGHPFPVHYRDGTARFIRLVGYPAGSVKKFRVSKEEITLEPGDSLIFYTDGLVEALFHENQVIGYDRLVETLPSLIRETAQETEAAIRTWFDRVSAKSELDDDVTIMVLQIHPVGNRP